MEEKDLKVLKLFIIFAVIVVATVVHHTTKTLQDFINIIVIPTAIFIPTAFLIHKFKLYRMSDNYKKHSRYIFIILLCSMMIVADKIPRKISLFLMVLCFEIVILFYFLISSDIRKSRHGNENNI